MSLGLLTSYMRVLKNLKGTEYYDAVINNIMAKEGDDFEHIHKRKSRFQLARISAVVCGIEFCYAAETAFVSPILLSIGVPVLYMTLVWCCSPLLGFFLAPLLGSLSDRCSFRLGRRRPFILLLSLGIVLGLILVPNGKDIAESFGDSYNNSRLNVSNSNGNTSIQLQSLKDNTTFDHELVEKEQFYIKPHVLSIIITTIGVVLLDFSCDACQSPSRAYMLDVTVPEDHSAGLTTFTIMAGLGGSLGYLLGGIDWSKIMSTNSFIGGHVRFVFTFVLVMYIVCLLVTISSYKEVPLNKISGIAEQLQKKNKSKKGGTYHKFTNEESPEKESNSLVSNGGQGEMFEMTETRNTLYKTFDMKSNGELNSNYEANHVTNATVEETCESRQSFSKSEPVILPTEVSLKTYLKSIIQMPKSIGVLCLTNLFCWMSLVCYSLYFTDFVGQSVYGGHPSAPLGSEMRRKYEEGVRMGSFGMSLYSLSCSIYSLCIETLVRKFKAKPVYILSQLVYTVGMVIMATVRHPVVVVLLSPTAGVMYATLFTMPYIILAHYHSNDTFDDIVSKEHRIKQVRGLGTDIALLSSMVFVAQLILSAMMGSIVHYIGSTVAVIVAASVLSFCGAVSSTQVMYLDL
ncbi:unnamed protein product [Owenia fusiformis]|uniref:Uncharacterized protein n=1 Tax=Owenia fusiformis TaxID=6347 RepID=A0A8J1XZ92_OWEFU|nr:unnamed protein product [Owenia fusiformis]